MKRHRFIGIFNLDKLSILNDRELVHQIKTVLKLRPGEEIVLCDGKGSEALARIDQLSLKEIRVTLLKQIKSVTESERSVVLYCALLKRENFEWVVQKATEVGVKEIVPLITRRTVKLNFKLDRLQKIAQEAAEQSGRGVVPSIHPPLSFDAALDVAKDNQNNFLFDISENSIYSFKFPVSSVGLFIGPEGGWDPMEITDAKKAGCQIASLGPLTLRAESAAIIATYLACQS